MHQTGGSATGRTVHALAQKEQGYGRLVLHCHVKHESELGFCLKRTEE